MIGLSEVTLAFQSLNFLKRCLCASGIGKEANAVNPVSLYDS